MSKFARIENGIVQEIFDSIEVDREVIEFEEILDKKSGKRVKKVKLRKKEKSPRFHADIMAQIEGVPNDAEVGFVKTENGFEVPKPIEVPYTAKRAAEYPPMGDQLDAVMKWLATENEISIPEELKSIAMKCMSVKAKYPKPTKQENENDV